MKKLVAMLGLASCACATIAYAQAQPSPWYAGISAGRARMSHQIVSNRETTFVNVQSVQSDLDLSDTGWKALAGWRYNDTLALELYYADLGRHHVLSNVVGGDPPAPGSFALTHGIDGFGADVVVSAPVMSLFNVFARVGAYQAHLKAEAQLGGFIQFTNGSPSDNHRNAARHETVAHYGVGLEWWLRRNVALRAEYERFDKIGKAFEVGGSGTTGRASTDLISAGVLFRF